MPTYQDVSAQLAKAVDDVIAKKITLDKAVEAMNKASGDYNSAVDNAKKLRTEMALLLDSVFGTPNERIRA